MSEALRSEVFVYLARSGRYGGTDRELRLEAEVQRLEHEAGDLERYTEGGQPKIRPVPSVHDVDSTFWRCGSATLSWKAITSQELACCGRGCEH